MSQARPSQRDANFDCETAAAVGHAVWVRVSHWVLAASVLILAFSGFLILMVHPRLYWGEVGNDLTPALFELPISRNYLHAGWENHSAFFAEAGAPISASRTFDIFNENGWARSLHFLASWFLVVTCALYLLAGVFSGHLRRDLVPRASELTLQRFWSDLVRHLRLRIPRATGGPPYGLLQKGAYCGVVLVAVPMMLLTGLAQSPAVTAGYPFLADMFGGSQSARTIHFFVFVGLMLFLIVHVLMVVLSGFRRQIVAMTFGRSR